MNTDTDSTPKKRKIELPKGGTTPRSFANYLSPGIGMEVESNEVKYKDRVVSVSILYICFLNQNAFKLYLNIFLSKLCPYPECSGVGSNRANAKWHTR